MSAVAGPPSADNVQKHPSCPEKYSFQVMVNPSLTSFYLLVSGIVVVDITDCQLVLVLALLDIILTLWHLVLQLPHLETSVISSAERDRGKTTELQTRDTNTVGASNNLELLCKICLQHVVTRQNCLRHWDPHFSSSYGGDIQSLQTLMKCAGENIGIDMVEIKIASEC